MATCFVLRGSRRGKPEGLTDFVELGNTLLCLADIFQELSVWKREWSLAEREKKQPGGWRSYSTSCSTFTRVFITRP